jgi:hypothetical protein
MPEWLHWILTFVLGYPIFLIISLLVGVTVALITSLTELLLTGSISSVEVHFINSKLQIIQDFLVGILSILILSIGIYFLHKGSHIGASISFVIFASLLRQLFADMVFFQETRWLRWWIRFLYEIGIATGVYFSYVILSLF